MGLAVGLAGLSQSPSLLAVSVDFEGDRVVASGLPAGGTAVLFGVSRVWVDLSTRVVKTHELVVDDDGDGAVELEAPVVAGSIWVAVDLATGAWILAAPPQGALRDGSELAPEIELDAATGNGRLKFVGRALDLLVVRPGVGAWVATSRDGGDEEGPGDGFVRIDHAELIALGDSEAAPRSVGAGDLVVGIDPDSLRVLIRRGSQLPVAGVE